MVVKVFFDVTWTGPQLKVDANGRKAAGGDDSIKGELQLAVQHRVKLLILTTLSQSAPAASTLSFSTM